MQLDPRICERARLSRDARFDGRFYVGVLTTGIFCRPICPAPSPKPANVRFFASAAAASHAGLRPCLRCRPEASPGTPAWNGTSATVARALRQLDAGAVDEGGVELLAARVGVGARHLCRLFQKHLGASPIAVAQTRRLLFAKKLLDETELKIADVAFAAGFGSVRRFNDLFRRTYDRTPGELRRLSRPPVSQAHGELPHSAVTLLLPYRPPLDWSALIGFLQPRAIPGVETIGDDFYRRNIAIGTSRGRIEVRFDPGGNSLRLAIDFPDSTALLPIATRVRRLFDLDADPAEVSGQLAADPTLRPLAAKRPGLRVPGAWSGFEIAVRALLGQQVTVKGATTLAGRLVERYGPPAAHGFTFPPAQRLVRARFAGVGLTRARAAALRSLAAACAQGALRLDPGVDVDRTLAELQHLDGIGDWTAQYVAMRALSEPDAFPSTDLGLLEAGARLASSGKDRLTPARLRRFAEPWRPWRAYAAMHLWTDSSEPKNKGV
ncbi:MAG: DNA-3-methyladenine glycosylase 2 family protein [Thermoanaerobaculia bacterium]